MSDVTPPENSPAPPEGEVPERQTTPFLVLQFFIFPLAIVAVCVTVFVAFGLISSSPRKPKELLAEARRGGGMFNIKRWQAAHALAGALESKETLAEARKDPQFVEEVLALYRETAKGEGDDVLLRRYLALALGHLGDRRATEDLRQTLQQGGTDQETLIYAAWALGRIGDEAALPELLALTKNEDPGLRKSGIHAVGAFDTPAAREALTQALYDPAEDVRWNAALALGRRGDAAAAPVLAKMLDRAHIEESTKTLDAEERESVILEAVRSASRMPDPSLEPALVKLRDGDSSLKVREAARAALAQRGK